jgi:hypothetical protein
MSGPHPFRRLATWPQAARLGLEGALLARRRAQALAIVGEHCCADAEREQLDRMPGPMGLALDTRKQLQALEQALRESFHRDQVDFGRLAGWVRILIVLRGLLARGVHRVELRRLRREASRLYQQVGALRLEALASMRAAWATPELRAHVTEVVRRSDACERARAVLLAPFGGQALPSWMHAVGRELREVSGGLLRELRSRMVPRLASLAGMGAGWWVAQSFTTSQWHGVLSSLGLRRGGPRVVSAETYGQLQFWLPLIAAAVCGYLMSRAVKWIHRRYEPPALPAAQATERTLLNVVPSGVEPR